jgi:peptide/nickel transport system substrate-binding protein
MKKITGLMILGLVMLFAISACGDGGTPAVTTPQETAPPAAGTPPATTADPTPTAPADTADTGDSEGPFHGGTLRVVGTTEGAGPIGVPWTGHVSAQDTWLQGPVMEALLREHQDSTVSPLLATSWEVSREDGTIYFEIRQGVEFHDGSPLNAESAKWNLEKTLEYSNPAVRYTVDIVGPYSIRLNMETPVTNATINTFAQLPFRFISMEHYETYGFDSSRENPIGTGPFMLINGGEYVRGSHTRAIRNPNYWNEGLPFLDAVEYHLLTDAMTQTLALQAPHGDGSIDALRTHNSEQIATFRDLGYTNLWINQMGTALFPSSANEDSPMANLYVRKAISAAIDRDMLCMALGFNVWTPLYQFTTPARPLHFVTEPGYGVPSFDLDQARAWMAEGGFPDGFRTGLYVQPGTADTNTAAALQAMLAEIGIHVDIVFPDAGAFVALTRVDGWEGLVLHNVMNAVVHANTASMLFTRASGNFISMRKSDTFEELIDTSITVFGDNVAEVRAVSDYIADEALFISMWLTNSSTIVRPGIEGLSFRDNIIRYEYVWFDWQG